MSKVENDNKYESILAIQFAVTADNAHYNYPNMLNCTISEGNLYGNGDDFSWAARTWLTPSAPTRTACLTLPARPATLTTAST